MGLATKRLIVPISPSDKKLVEERAARAGKLSVAEFVRRAALNYEPADQASEQELHQLLEGFDALHENTLAQLDRTDAALDAALAHFARSRG
jgi:hypothetical protein